MIARIVARWRRTDELTAARVELRQVHQSLSKEQMLTTGLTSDVNELTKQNIALRLKVDVAEAQVARLRADNAYVQAERCECGGDAELHWRKVAAAAEAQAQRDRANAVLLADEVARLRFIVEQLERAGVVRVA